MLLPRNIIPSKFNIQDFFRKINLNPDNYQVGKSMVNIIYTALVQIEYVFVGSSGDTNREHRLVDMVGEGDSIMLPKSLVSVLSIPIL